MSKVNHKMGLHAVTDNIKVVKILQPNGLVFKPTKSVVLFIFDTAAQESSLMYLQGKRMFTFPVFRYPTIISDYLIRMSVSEPISIALNISERKRVEKNNLAHTCVYNKAIGGLQIRGKVSRDSTRGGPSNSFDKKKGVGRHSPFGQNPQRNIDGCSQLLQAFDVFCQFI